jgi:hypothetical protein
MLKTGWSYLRCLTGRVATTPGSVLTASRRAPPYRAGCHATRVPVCVPRCRSSPAAAPCKTLVLIANCAIAITRSADRDRLFQRGLR